MEQFAMLRLATTGLASGLRFLSRLAPALAPAVMKVAARTVHRVPISVRARAWFGETLDGHLGDLLGRVVFYSGVWEPDITRFVWQRLKPGATFVDIGANIGYFALMAGMKVGPEGSVVAVDPSPATGPMLSRNALRARHGNVRAVLDAVTASAATVEFFEGPPGNSGKASLMRHAEGNGPRATVPGRPLAAILGDAEIASASIIKIDVEGYEAIVLQQVLELLPRLPRDVIVVSEVLPSYWPALGVDLAQTLHEFEAAGFSIFAFADRSYEATFGFDVSQPPRLLPVERPPELPADLVFCRDR